MQVVKAVREMSAARETEHVESVVGRKPVFGRDFVDDTQKHEVVPSPLVVDELVVLEVEIPVTIEREERREQDDILLFGELDVVIQVVARSSLGTVHEDQQGIRPRAVRVVVPGHVQQVREPRVDLRRLEGHPARVVPVEPVPLLGSHGARGEDCRERHPYDRRYAHSPHLSD